MLNKQGYTHAHVCTNPSARTQARTRARAHTHTKLCNIYCLSTQQYLANAAQCYPVSLVASCALVRWSYHLIHWSHISGYVPSLYTHCGILLLLAGYSAVFLLKASCTCMSIPFNLKVTNNLKISRQ